MKICPKNGRHKRFITTAHEQHDWEVDGEGTFLRDLGCLDVTHKPDPSNIWVCAICGTEAIEKSQESVEPMPPPPPSLDGMSMTAFLLGATKDVEVPKGLTRDVLGSALRYYEGLDKAKTFTLQQLRKLLHIRMDQAEQRLISIEGKGWVVRRPDLNLGGSDAVVFAWSKEFIEAADEALADI